MSAERERGTRGTEALSDAVAIRTSLAEPRAFEAVFQRHFDAVHAYVQRRVGSDLAEDVAAETFARAFDRRRAYDFRFTDARPWLLGIASNLLRRHWRAERRRIAAYARAAGSDLAADERAGSDLTGLVKALDRLSAEEREVLFLYAIADLSYEEIAVALRRPVGTVRSRLSRARGRLRARLRESAWSRDASTCYEIEESRHV